MTLSVDNYFFSENQFNIDEIEPIDIFPNDLKRIIVCLSDLPARNDLLRVSKAWNKCVHELWGDLGKVFKLPLNKEISTIKDKLLKAINLLKDIKLSEIENHQDIEDLSHEKNSLEKEQVINFILSLKKDIKVWMVREKKIIQNFRLSNHTIQDSPELELVGNKFNSQVQEEIKRLLKSIEIKDILILQQFLEAANTLILWEQLQKHGDPLIVEHFDFKKFSSIEEIVEKAKTFFNDTEMETNWCEENRNTLSRLIILDLRELGLSQLNEKIFDFLPALRTVILYRNNLKSLPENFSKLKYLDAISLCGNNFETFPECFLNLPNLRVIRMSANSLTVLPDWIKKLNLTELDLVNNKAFLKAPDGFSASPLAKVTKGVDITLLDTASQRMPYVLSSFYKYLLDGSQIIVMLFLIALLYSTVVEQFEYKKPKGYW